MVRPKELHRLLPYPRRLVLSNRSNRKKGRRPNKTRRRVEAGDAVPADAEQQEEESDIVADFAPEGAASAAPEEFPLTTGDSREAELPKQDLGQVQPSPEPPVAEGDEAAVEGADVPITPFLVC